MSELDSDLYGGAYNLYSGSSSLTTSPDLYGTEDVDGVAEPAGQEAQEPRAASEPAEEFDTKPTLKSLSPQPAPAATAPAPTPISSWSEPSTSASLPTAHSEPPIAQQIPTYSESSDADFREPPNAAYETMSVQERSIRPSEMKDEGCVPSLFPC
ncbi:hypothetical protein BV25DRAFT_1140373 [Artomyces pyxidatus]|uniref:Uncharacterized protein n=1 Tax=Artomyces pyxidatus TaxID=48021 RepID=A0ACB8ST50_9AGAM|nr:hypothetical protein BV25DRAFT_1140373 [Artomyces pyxidatus]